MPFGSPFLAFHWPYCTLSRRGKQWPNRPLSHFSTGCPPGKHLTIAPNPGTLKGRKEGCLVETERAREAISHWAQEGESLWDYGARWNRPVEELVACNPHISDIDWLQQGEKVVVP